MPPLIQAENLTFWFDQNAPPLIEGLNLTIHPGECLMLIGPSGCGKSTLAFILAGLYPEYAGCLVGSVSCASGPLSELTPDLKARRVSILFQNSDDQFCMDTVGSELLFTLENLNHQGDFSLKVQELLSLVGLNGFESRSVMELSGGEKQKLSLAAAIAVKPDLLILDEPLANLDADSAAEFVKLLERLHREGTALMIVDHILDRWLSLVSRFAVMDSKGRLIFDDLKTGDLAQKSELFNCLGLIPIGGHCFPRKRKYPSQPEIVLKAQGLTVKRRGKVILRDLDLQLSKGSLTAVLGANGSGKTTLFLTLAGLLRKKGRLTVQGPVGLVFQNPGFQFLAQSVLDEVLLSLAPGGAAKRNSSFSGHDLAALGRDDSGPAAKALELIEEFKLSDKHRLSPWRLSQGEQRRLAVLTMLCKEQNLLFLDEPTYSQDHHNTLVIMELLASKVEKGLTAVIATHDVALAKAYADKIFTLKDGSLLENSESF
ncbi:MAG: ATP-binding cassette domain-containing protein [Deltaproteobacteria bacterium]|jgi:energy-coupling factor transport system ATP-binding protein|nr:ATP-binding cassette domain-containing protein [Deltaproteobacteria bacterium]